MGEVATAPPRLPAKAGSTDAVDEPQADEEQRLEIGPTQAGSTDAVDEPQADEKQRSEIGPTQADDERFPDTGPTQGFGQHGAMQAIGARMLVGTSTLTVRKSASSSPI